MQTKIISHFIFLFFGITLSAQTGQQNPCINEVSTDPDAPTNLNLPNETSPGYDQYFLNNFDWVPRTSSSNLAKYQTINMSAALLDAGEIENIFSDQQHPHYSYIYDYLEPNPKNGWELIGVNLGRNTKNSTT
jgi:hypothetical protein